MKKIFKIYALLTVLFGISPLLCIESFAQTAGEINEGGNIWYDPETDTRWELINGDWYLIHEPGGGEDPNGGGNNEPPQGGGNDYDDWDYDDWYDYWDEQWDYWDWDEYWNTVIFGGGSGPNNGNNPPVYTCPSLNSVTEAEMPVNRARTKLGIGEEFSIRVDNLCPGGTVQWDVLNTGANGKKLNQAPDGKFAEFSAGYYPGTITIRATISASGQCINCPDLLELQYEVVEPDFIIFVPAENPTVPCPGSATKAIHDYYRPSAGFYAKLT